jgi:hypothetical protein
VPKLVREESGSVGRDSDELQPRLGAPLGEVPGEFLFSVTSLYSEVALELEHGLSEQRVSTTPDLRERSLEVDLGAAGAQAMDEQVVDERADLLMPRAAQEFENDVAKTLGGYCHGPSLPGDDSRYEAGAAHEEPPVV